MSAMRGVTHDSLIFIWGVLQAERERLRARLAEAGRDETETIINKLVYVEIAMREVQL